MVQLLTDRICYYHMYVAPCSGASVPFTRELLTAESVTPSIINSPTFTQRLNTERLLRLPQRE